MTLRALAFGAACALVAACANGTPASPPLPAAPSRDAGADMPIQHVVVVIQENRTFDSLFATYPGADGAVTGRGKNLANPKGADVTIPLAKSPLISPVSPYNLHKQFVQAYDGGKMDGFDKIVVQGANGLYLYRYVDPQLIQPYWAMAHQYVLADRMFPTQSSASFTAHQDLISGGTELAPGRAIIDVPSWLPWGCDAWSNVKTSIITSTGDYLLDKGPGPCFTWRTLRDTLDAKQLSWRYYVPLPVGSEFAANIWNAFDAIHDVRYGPEWNTNVLPTLQVIKDIRGGRLAAVSWVCPDWLYSDHPGAQSDSSPSWVASIVNEIGRSKYWSSTAIVVVWDDWGGFYDHVPPPQKYYYGLGIRVPMLVIGPYAKRGYVAHEQYEFGSVVRFIEDVYHLPRLGTTDTTARDFAADVFDFTKPPRTFTPIPAKYDADYFLKLPPSGHALDDD